MRGGPPGLGDVLESVSWACDAQECEGSGGVAGVASERGGSVGVAVGAQDGAGEVAQAGHGAGAVPVRTWEASSA